MVIIFRKSEIKDRLRYWITSAILREDKIGKLLKKSLTFWVLSFLAAANLKRFSPNRWIKLGQKWLISKTLLQMRRRGQRMRGESSEKSSDSNPQNGQNSKIIVKAIFVFLGLPIFQRFWKLQVILIKSLWITVFCSKKVLPPNKVFGTAKSLVKNVSCRKKKKFGLQISKTNNKGLVWSNRITSSHGRQIFYTSKMINVCTLAKVFAFFVFVTSFFTCWLLSLFKVFFRSQWRSQDRSPRLSGEIYLILKTSVSFKRPNFFKKQLISIDRSKLSKIETLKVCV